MNRTAITALPLFVAAAILFAVAVPILAQADDTQPPYYAFFPSEKGGDYKRFVHNIFGFSIDIPSPWTFGTYGALPTAVVLLYPDGMDSGEFSENYETIEIGQIPFFGMTLEETEQTTMQGIAVKHPTFAVVQRPRKRILNGMSAISWIYQWPSKTGYVVIEYITLVHCPSGIRSLAVRTTRGDYASRMNFYEGILETFSAFTPNY